MDARGAALRFSYLADDVESLAAALEQRFAVGEGLARGAQAIGAACDQLEHGLRKAAAAVAYGAVLAGEIGGERAEIQHRLTDHGADPRLRRALAECDEMHGAA